MSPSQSETRLTGVRRRTLVGAAAWSVPAITLYAASPVAAASPATPLDVLTVASSAEAHGYSGIPLLDDQAEVTATLTTHAGSPIVGREVVFTAPTGTHFAGGVSAARALTDGAGRASVTLHRTSADSPSATVVVRAWADTASGDLELIIMGPVTTVEFPVPDVAEGQEWRLSEPAPSRIRMQVPPRPAAGGTDQWVQNASGPIHPGTWLTERQNKILYWATLVPGSVDLFDHRLDTPLAAREWTFTMRNVGGTPDAVYELNRSTGEEGRFRVRQTFSFTLP